MHQHILQACVLLALYRCAGKWVSIEQIASRMGVAREHILPVCTELSAHAQVRHTVVDSRDLYASCVVCAGE
jgi:hypothetical protein